MTRALGLVLVVACGGNDGVIDNAAARDAVEQFAKLAQAMAAGSGSDGATAAIAMVRADASIVTVDGNPIDIPFADAWDATDNTCTAGSCMFGNAATTPTMTTTRFDGQIARNNDRDDLSLSASEGDCAYRQGDQDIWMLDGMVTANDTSVDGGIIIHGRTGCSDQTPSKWSHDVEIDYNAVMLDASGCPISGSVHVTNTFMVLDPSVGGSNYSVSGTATFHGCRS